MDGNTPLSFRLLIGLAIPFHWVHKNLLLKAHRSLLRFNGLIHAISVEKLGFRGLIDFMKSFFCSGRGEISSHANTFRFKRLKGC